MKMYSFHGDLDFKLQYSSLKLVFTILEQLINDLHLHAKPIPFVPILGKNNNLLDY